MRLMRLHPRKKDKRPTLPMEALRATRTPTCRAGTNSRFVSLTPITPFLNLNTAMKCPNSMAANMYSLAQKFQKEAIIRQMHEYKREKMTLETRLNDLTMRATYHDDHLRAIDAWFEQVRLLQPLKQFSSNLRITSYSTRLKYHLVKYPTIRRTYHSLQPFCQRIILASRAI